MRALAALATLALTLAVGAGSAIAHPIGYDDREVFIADDPPPPPPPPPPPAPTPPRKPRDSAIGFRIGVTHAGPVTAFALGLQGDLTLGHDLHAIAEYQYLMLLQPEDLEDMVGVPRASAGRGHHAAIGLRVNLGEATVKRAIRFYADADVTGGVALTHGPARATELVPDIALGLRFGYEMLRQDDSPARIYDAHFLVRAIRTEHDTGMMFGVGMEWGR